DSDASHRAGLARDSLGRAGTTGPAAAPYVSPDGRRGEVGANDARRGGAKDDTPPCVRTGAGLGQMLGFLERLADALARHLLAWLHRRVEPGSREWLDALTAEAECAADGWQRLRWALGGVPLVWTINERRHMNEPTRDPMRARIVAGIANIAVIAGGCAAI